MEHRIKKLDNADLNLFKEAVWLLHAVFETNQTSCAPDAQLLRLLQNPLFIIFVALHEGHVAAVLTAYEMPGYYEAGSEAYIYDIAVAARHQRKGLGSRLMDALKDYGKSQNIRLAFAEAHAEDMDALDFYQSTGGEPEHVVHFNYQLIRE